MRSSPPARPISRHNSTVATLQHVHCDPAGGRMLRIEPPRLLRRYISASWCSYRSVCCLNTVSNGTPPTSKGLVSVATGKDQAGSADELESYLQKRYSNGDNNNYTDSHSSKVKHRRLLVIQGPSSGLPIQGDDGEYVIHRSRRTGEETAIPIQPKTGAVDRRRVSTEEEYVELKKKLRKLRTWQRRQEVAEVFRKHPELAAAEARNQRLQYEQELFGEFLRRRLSGGAAAQSTVYDPEDCDVEDAVATAEACLAPEGGFLHLPRYAIECRWDPGPILSVPSKKGDGGGAPREFSREERNVARVASEIIRFVRFIREKHDKVFLAVTSIRRDSALWDCLKRFHAADSWNRILVTELSAAELMGAANLVVLSPDAELSLVDVDLGAGYPPERSSADRIIDQNTRELIRSEIRDKISKLGPERMGSDHLGSFHQYRAQLRPELVSKVTPKRRTRATHKDINKLIPDVVTSPKRPPSAVKAKTALVNDPITEHLLLGRRDIPRKCLVVGAIRSQAPSKFVGSTAYLADQWGCVAARLPIPEILGPYLHAMSAYVSDDEKSMVMSENFSLEHFLYHRRHDLPLDIVLKTLAQVASRDEGISVDSSSSEDIADKDTADNLYQSSPAGKWCEALLPLVPNRFLPQELEQRERPPPPGDESVWRRSLETPRPRISATWQKYFSQRRRKIWVPPTVIRLIGNPERTISDQFLADVNKNRIPKFFDEGEKKKKPGSKTDLENAGR